MVAVIGDVHGCFYTLQTLVEKIDKLFPDIPIYCVGDLVDRGNYSCEVVELVISRKILFTPGNHDLMFLAGMRQPLSIWAESWSYNGSDSTLKSYDDKMNLIDTHLDLIKSAPLFYDLKDCFISHAGISEKLKLDLKNFAPDNHEKLIKELKKNLYHENSIVWNRENLMNIGKLQVVGHTHRKEIYLDEKNNALYIDTTAFGNNRLTSVIIESNKLVEVIDQKTDKQDVNPRWLYYN